MDLASYRQRSSGIDANKGLAGNVAVAGKGTISLRIRNDIHFVMQDGEVAGGVISRAFANTGFVGLGLKLLPMRVEDGPENHRDLE